MTTNQTSTDILLKIQKPLKGLGVTPLEEKEGSIYAPWLSPYQPFISAEDTAVDNLEKAYNLLGNINKLRKTNARLRGMYLNTLHVTPSGMVEFQTASGPTFTPITLIQFKLQFIEDNLSAIADLQRKGIDVNLSKSGIAQHPISKILHDLTSDSSYSRYAQQISPEPQQFTDEDNAEADKDT